MTPSPSHGEGGWNRGGGSLVLGATGRADRLLATSGGRRAAMYHPDLIRHPDSLPRARAQRRLYAAELLSAQPVAVADRGQGGVPRAGRHRRPICARGAQPDPDDADAVGDRAPPICEAVRASRLHPVQPVPARPLRLPILRRPARADLRPCRSARPGRPDDLGECRHRLRAVQSQEGRPHAAAGADDPQPPARSGRPAGSCRSMAAASRPTISTTAGATVSTGTSSWRPRARGTARHGEGR